MKLYNVEIRDLNNEYLIKGRKQCENTIKLLNIVVYCMIGIFIILSAVVFLTSSLKDALIVVLVCFGVAIVYGILIGWLMRRLKKGLQEVDEEIDKRLSKRKISKRALNEIVQRNKEEKKENTIVFVIIVAIIAMIVIGFKACDFINSGSSFDDIFNKNPNEWSESDKDYVNGLFDWIDKNQ